MPQASLRNTEGMAAARERDQNNVAPYYAKLVAAIGMFFSIILVAGGMQVYIHVHVVGGLAMAGCGGVCGITTIIVVALMCSGVIRIKGRNKATVRPGVVVVHGGGAQTGQPANNMYPQAGGQMNGPPPYGQQPGAPPMYPGQQPGAPPPGYGQPGAPGYGQAGPAPPGYTQQQPPPPAYGVQGVPGQGAPGGQGAPAQSNQQYPPPPAAYPPPSNTQNDLAYPPK